MTERPRKRSLTLRGHRTSVSLEDTFWIEFTSIAKEQQKSINDLAAEIDEARAGDISLAGAIRGFVLQRLKSKFESK